MTDPWENLANAIILQAVKDYREARKKHRKRLFSMLFLV